jgi:hypothetical protein
MIIVTEIKVSLVTSDCVEVPGMERIRWVPLEEIRNEYDIYRYMN